MSFCTSCCCHALAQAWDKGQRVPEPLKAPRKLPVAKESPAALCGSDGEFW
jgi:hypothetical protein